MSFDLNLDSLHLARQLLSYELTVSASGESRGSAAFRVCEKLMVPLSTFAGVAGFRALLSRAVSLASSECDWVGRIGVGEDGRLEGLVEATSGISESEIEKGETAIVARLLGLLMTFVGNALTARILDDIWPEGEFRE